MAHTQPHRITFHRIVITRTTTATQTGQPPSSHLATSPPSKAPTFCSVAPMSPGTQSQNTSSHKTTRVGVFSLSSGRRTAHILLTTNPRAADTRPRQASAAPIQWKLPVASRRPPTTKPINREPSWCGEMPAAVVECEPACACTGGYQHDREEGVLQGGHETERRADVLRLVTDRAAHCTTTRGD